MEIDGPSCISPLYYPNLKIRNPGFRPASDNFETGPEWQRLRWNEGGMPEPKLAQRR